MIRRISLVATLAAGVRGLSAPRWVPQASPLLDSTAKHVLVDDEFALQQGSVIHDARRLFDDTHNRPDRSATERSFKWEHWNAGDGQYVHLRTPAASFFGGDPENSEDSGIFPTLCDLITEFGQRQLGMNSISPPWLSCYLDGHEQRLHTDAPHGPWAFVLSLTSDQAEAMMRGGETAILKPFVADMSVAGSSRVGNWLRGGSNSYK